MCYRYVNQQQIAQVKRACSVFSFLAGFPQKSNPADMIKNEMFSFLRDGNMQENIPALKEAVYRLVKMATQKTAGQKDEFRRRGDIPFEILEPVLMEIACEATALVLSGRLDGLEADN